MPSVEEHICHNLQVVKQRIARAAEISGRTAADVRLVAVTKYAPWEAVTALSRRGVLNFGESRPQQLCERHALFDDSVCWHMIGHLQRNKVRRTLECAEYIHSIDSLRLLAAVDRIAQELNITPKLFLEVNISGETAKDGFTPQEIQEHWHAFEQFPHVHIVGLMTMAPFSETPEVARPYFKQLRGLRDQLQDNGEITLPELSMGMSRDFEIAIEEGATTIRVGSSLFEGLK